MQSILQAIASKLPEPTLASVVDISVLALVIYALLNVVRGTRAEQVLVGATLLVAAYYGAVWGRLETLKWVFDHILPFLPFALIVLFQGEIRWALAKLGRNPFSSRTATLEVRNASDDIVMAAVKLSEQRTGALIVIERDTGLRTYTESGISLNAKLSYDLLVAIFQRGSPLHDGAVIVRKDRVVAAACFLPLSVSPGQGTQFGTRHRAAIGITEETDAVAIAVSEETGAVSFMLGGSIEKDLSSEVLARRLSDIFHHPYAPPATAGFGRGTPLDERPTESATARRYP
jgi:diadenylate cyclase